MSARQLPPQPNLRQLRRQAKDLLKAYRSGEPEAVSRVRDGLPRLTGASDEAVMAAACTLQDVQHVTAVKYGFDDWTALKDAVERLTDPVRAFHEAVEKGDVEAVAAALSENAELVAARPEPNGNTPLHVAAYSGQAEVARLLIDAGADVEATAGEGWRPLHNAAANDGLMSVLEVLIYAGSDVTAEACGEGGTPLAHALSYGLREPSERLARERVCPENLRIAAGLGRVDLIERMVGPDGSLSPEARRGRGFYRHHAEFPEWQPSDDPQEILDEALTYAAHCGRVDAIDLLIVKGANVNGRPYYATPLHQAVIRGEREAVERLLAHGADPTIRDGQHGGRAYDWTHYSRDPDLGQLLLEAGASRDLYAAVRVGTKEQVERLAADAGPDQITDAYKTAVRTGRDDLSAILKAKGAEPSLFDLIELGLTDEVRAALANGADANATRSRQVERIGEGLVTVDESLMQAAASNRRPEIGQVLAEAGASINLHGATFLDRAEGLEAIGSEGDVDAVDAFGMTPLHRAIQGGAIEAARRLIAMGADVTRTSDTYTFGGRAIHVAAETDASPEMIDLLIEAGSDVNDRRNPGTPLEVAERSGRKRTAEVLRSRGAV